jgi:hypothetical protein
MGRGGVYRLNTGPLPELLDIGVERYRVPPGLFLKLRRHNVTQTHGNSARYARSGRGNEPEDGCYDSRRWLCRDGEHRRAGTTYALEEHRWASPANTVEEYGWAGSAYALEVARSEG